MNEIFKYIYSDYYRYYGKNPSRWDLIWQIMTVRNHCFVYSFWFRLASKKNKNPLYYFAMWKHLRLTRKYGIQIPAGTKIGYGFYIGHGVGIIINGGTVIGNNVNISQFLSIGTNKRTPAVIGDNVYIGPHVSIVEDVHIGNNATIAAGAVVVKDVPENATVGGVPAKVLNYNDPGRFVGRRWYNA